MKKTVIIFMLIAFAKLTVAGLVPWGLWQTAGDELPTEVGLYHLETNMLDEISETYGYTSGIYTNDCKVGDYAAYFSGESWIYANTVNSTLLNGKTNITISAWVKLHAYPTFAGLIFSRWEDHSYSGMAVDTTGIRWYCYGGLSTAPIDLDKWYFVVGTRDGNTGEGKLYLNGELKGTSAATATFTQHAIFRLAWDDFLPTRTSHCTIDEVGFWDTCLTSNQQYNLYIQLGGE